MEQQAEQRVALLGSFSDLENVALRQSVRASGLCKSSSRLM